MLRNRSIFKSHDPVGIGGISFRVRNLDDCGAFIIETLEHIHDLFPLTRVEIASRFVSQDDSRVCYHSASNAYELLLSTGKLAGEKIFLADDLKSIERVTDNRLPVLLFDVSIRKRPLDIPENSSIIQYAT